MDCVNYDVLTKPISYPTYSGAISCASYDVPVVKPISYPTYNGDIDCAKDDAQPISCPTYSGAKDDAQPISRPTYSGANVQLSEEKPLNVMSRKTTFTFKKRQLLLRRPNGPSESFYDSAMSKKRIFSFKKQRPRFYRSNRSIYMNRKKMACLAIGEKGYTITNGVVTASRDGAYPATDIIREVCEFRAAFLLVADQKTYDQIKKLRNDYETDILKKKQVYIAKESNCKNMCMECKDEDCHRWRAAVALTAVYKFPFDPASHGIK